MVLMQRSRFVFSCHSRATALGMYKNEFNGIMNFSTLINLNMHSSFVVL